MWSSLAIAFNKLAKLIEWCKHQDEYIHVFPDSSRKCSVTWSSIVSHTPNHVCFWVLHCTPSHTFKHIKPDTSSPLPKNKSFIKPLNRCIHVSRVCIECIVLLKQLLQAELVPRVGTEHTMRNNGCQIEIYLWIWKQRIFCWVQWAAELNHILTSWLNLSIYMHMVSLHVPAMCSELHW